MLGMSVSVEICDKDIAASKILVKALSGLHQLFVAINISKESASRIVVRQD